MKSPLSGLEFRKSGRFLILGVSGENPEPVAGLGAAEAMATESSGLAGFGLASENS